MKKKTFYLFLCLLLCGWAQLYSKDKTPDIRYLMTGEYENQEDDLFTEAGNYYVSNKGNNKYVVIDAPNYNATASIENKEDADIITLDFDDNGIVTKMENLYGDGDMIAILEQVKTHLKNTLDNNDLNSDFVEEMFKIKLVWTDHEDGSIYFCFDIPQIENIGEIRNYLLNEGGINNQLVKDYLNLLLQPGKRIYLCITDENGTFSFTEDNSLDATKWMVEEYVIPEDDLFTEAGNYYVSNKGNNKYVVIDAANYNATASVDKQYADVITIDFDENGIVSTMLQKYGTGDMIATLTMVKNILRSKLEQNNMDASFVDDMFDIKLVKTGENDNSLYFCFDIPRINNLTAIRNYLNAAINNERVKAYLEVLLQPGKRIYLNIVDEIGTFGFTRDKTASSSIWMLEEAKHDPADYLSNTLPVLYINTVDETPIVDKENYIQGSYYLDANGCGDYVSVGSEEEPLALQIKGRGNSSWQHPKKPYRLKLDKKAALLGMPKSKHWVLLAAYSDALAHARDYLCFKISEKMGLPYTTRCIPIEVVLNGDYIGMYFLTEHIRIDKDRVNITEQANGETDPSAITGGWLLEIDNYVETNQIKLIDKKANNSVLRVTYHSPDSLSQEQLNYLTNLIHVVHDAVCTDDKTSTEWEQYIDLDELAQFYVVQEAIDNVYAFGGSCWFYKDQGDSTKLQWGPLWDNSSSLLNRNDFPDQMNYIYNSPVNNHWIGEIAKFPRFQLAVRNWWKKYRDEVFPTMLDEVDAYEQLATAALASDYLRWGIESANNPHIKLQRLKRLLTNKFNFLCSRWNDPQEAITLSEMMTDGIVGSEYIINDNLAVVNAVENGSRVFVTDGNNNWLQILAGEYYNQLANNTSIGSLRGIFTGKYFIPLFLLTAEPEINDATLTVVPQSYTINTEFEPVVNEVIAVSGIYNAASGSLQADNDDNIKITLDTSWLPSWPIENGKRCYIDGVVQIKEPWPATETMLNSFEFPYQNFTIFPLNVDTITAINNIEDDINSDTLINVYNMQGQLIKHGVKKSEATQGLLPGIYLIGKKKVVIAR